MNMIVDLLENAKQYSGYGHGVTEALNFLTKTDLASLPNGKLEINGDKLFAVVQRYQGRPVAEAKWEYHEKYLDLQYVGAGEELIGYAPWDEKHKVEMAYDSAKDAGLIFAPGVMIPVNAGMFAVFAPRELHAPCLAANLAKPDIFKIVMKCRWDS
jgi:YhcH/YjgK/YiaL family protein